MRTGGRFWRIRLRRAFRMGCRCSMRRGSGETRREGLWRERSKMVLILAEPSSDAARRLDETAEEYKRKFSQESVLRLLIRRVWRSS